MEVLFLRVLVVSVTVSALLLPLLLCRKWLEKRYAPQTRWRLWAGLSLLLLFCCLWGAQKPVMVMEIPDRPVTVPTLSRRGSELNAAPQQGGTGQKTTGQTAAGVPAPAIEGISPQAGVSRARMPQKTTVSLTALLAYLWFGVGLALLTQELIRCQVTRWRLLNSSIPVKKPEEEVQALGLTGKVRFRQGGGISSPVTVGLFRPVILLPEGRTAPLVIRHELLHVKRRDIQGKALIFLACALHWFNPLVWLMARFAGRDVEAACDAQVVSELDAAGKRAYGELLLACAEGQRGLPCSTRFGSGKKQMKARLTQLFRPGRRSPVLVCLLLAAALLLSGLAVCHKQKPTADGTYYATCRAAEVMVQKSYDAVEFKLVDYYPMVNWFLPQGKSVILPLAEELTLSGKPVEGEWEKAVFEFFAWPSLRSTAYLGRDDVLELTVSGGKVIALTRHEGARNVEGLVYENTQAGFALLLPENWAGKYTVVEAGEELWTFYRTAARRENDHTAGVVMNLALSSQAEFDALYGDKDLDGLYQTSGPKITVLGHAGEQVAYLHIDFPAGMESELRQMAEDAAGITANDFFYTAGGLTAAENSQDALLTIEGFELGTPFEDLPQSFRSTLTKERTEDLTGEGAGVWITYTAPGIEVVTTQVAPDWELMSERARQEHQGKEFLSVIRVTDSAYPTTAGLKVGDSVERCGELGYDKMPGSVYRYQMGLQTLTLTVEDGVVTAMESCDGLHYVGSIFY